MRANICGERIRFYRLKLGWDQAELAAALSVDHGIDLTQSDISEIERTVRGVKDFELLAISKVLNVSVVELVEPPNKEDNGGE
jgi:transcriptional regulator with XRE-family HTH domain